MALPRFPGPNTFSEALRDCEDLDFFATADQSRQDGRRRFAYVIFLSVAFHCFVLSLQLNRAGEPPPYGARDGTILLHLETPTPKQPNPLETLLDELLNFEVSEQVPLSPEMLMLPPAPEPVPPPQMPALDVANPVIFERLESAWAPLEVVLPPSDPASLPVLPSQFFDEVKAQAKPTIQPPRSTTKLPPSLEKWGDRPPLPKIESKAELELKLALPKITDAEPAKEILPLAGPDGTPPKIGLRTSASLLENPNPPYPAEALERGLQGRVVLEIFIDAKGAITEAKVYASSGHRILDEAAVVYARTLRCRPERSNDVPVPSRHFLPLRYTIAP